MVLAFPVRSLADAARPDRWWLLVVAAAVVPYLGVLDGGMVAGDLEFIAQNPLMDSTRPFVDAFSHGYWFKGEAGQPAPYYRPLVVLLDWLDHARFGLDPVGYHVTNLLLHVAASLAVFVLALQVLQLHWAALASALVFAAHPMHVQAVAYISGRTSVMAALFAVMSIGCVLEVGRRLRASERSTSLQVVAVALCALALLSKESAAPLPALALAAVMLSLGATARALRRTRGLLAAMLLVVVCDLVLRAWVLGQVGSPHRPLWARLGTLETLLSIAKTVGYYPQQLLWPQALSYLPPFVPALSGWDVAGLMWLAGLTLATAWVLWPRAQAPRARFALFWLLACLAPVSGVIALEYFVKEQHAYLPAVGFVLLLGLALERGSSRLASRAAWCSRAAWLRRVPALAVAVLVVCFAVVAADHARHFSGPRALYTRIVSLESRIAARHFAHPAMSQSAHRYAIAHLNLGLLERGDGQCEAARGRFERSEALARNRALRAQAAFLYGDCAARLGQHEAARVALERALEHDPRQPDIRRRLAELRGQRVR